MTRFTMDKRKVNRAKINVPLNTSWGPVRISIGGCFVALGLFVMVTSPIVIPLSLHMADQEWELIAGAAMDFLACE